MLSEAKCRELAEQMGLRNERFCLTVKTGTTFLKGRGMLREQFNGQEQDLMLRVNAAKRAGYTPNANDTYIPTLAKFTGDPDAFVPANDPLGHIDHVLQKNNQSCEGAVNRQRRKEPVKKVPIAEHIVQERLRQAVRQAPELSRDKNQLRKMREQIISTHGKKS